MARVELNSFMYLNHYKKDKKLTTTQINKIYRHLSYSYFDKNYRNILSSIIINKLLASTDQLTESAKSIVVLLSLNFSKHDLDCIEINVPKFNKFLVKEFKNEPNIIKLFEEKMNDVIKMSGIKKMHKNVLTNIFMYPSDFIRKMDKNKNETIGIIGFYNIILDYIETNYIRPRVDIKTVNDLYNEIIMTYIGQDSLNTINNTMIIDRDYNLNQSEYNVFYLLTENIIAIPFLLDLDIRITTLTLRL